MDMRPIRHRTQNRPLCYLMLFDIMLLTYTAFYDIVIIIKNYFYKGDLLWLTPHLTNYLKGLP